MKTLDDAGIVIVEKKKRITVATLYYGELVSVSLRTAHPKQAAAELRRIIHIGLNREES